MPDNWGYVAAAYGLTTAVLALYLRYLNRRERELSRMRTPASARPDGAAAGAVTQPGGPASQPR